MKRALAIAVATALLVGIQVALPAYACACGAPAPMPGTEVGVDGETAIVRWDGEREEILMRLDMRSDAGETGLVVPTPNPATVTAGDAAVFESLEIETLPRAVVEWDWWGGNPFDGSMGAPSAGAPEILDQVQLGPIQATTLAASDAEGLTTWLDENGYELSPAVTSELAPYVADGWSFVALKLTGELPLDGELDPIRFTFDSDSLVYPMRMSRAATSEQNVRLYILGDHRVDVSGTDGPLGIDPHVYWAAPVVDPELQMLGSYLTAIEFYWDDPAAQITGDIAIADSATDDEIVPTYTVTEVVSVAGVPVGPFVIMILVVLAVAGLVIWLITARRRRA